jgi:hypothetical protein
MSLNAFSPRSAGRQGGAGSFVKPCKSLSEAPLCPAHDTSLQLPHGWRRLLKLTLTSLVHERSVELERAFLLTFQIP